VNSRRSISCPVPGTRRFTSYKLTQTTSYLHWVCRSSMLSRKEVGTSVDETFT
jgi:hypothetical protein